MIYNCARRITEVRHRSKVFGEGATPSERTSGKISTLIRKKSDNDGYFLHKTYFCGIYSPIGQVALVAEKSGLLTRWSNPVVGSNPTLSSEFVTNLAYICDKKLVSLSQIVTIFATGFKNCRVAKLVDAPPCLGGEDQEIDQV
jgi:hypothetical protein